MQVNDKSKRVWSVPANRGFQYSTHLYDEPLSHLQPPRCCSIRAIFCLERTILITIPKFIMYVFSGRSTMR